MTVREVPRRPAERLEETISDCHMDIARFAEVCSLDKAHAWRFVRRKQAISMAAAIKIANALRAAQDAGDIAGDIKLPTAVELCPALGALFAANVATPGTGTHGGR